jgi:FtsZ-interacting cell division protein YlmF
VSLLDSAPAAPAPPRRPVVRAAAPANAVRPITTLAYEEDLSVVAPQSYEESKRIGDDLKGRRALVVSLVNADAEVGRRILDFSSGVVYTLGGRIQKVSHHVYLLVPPNVRVSPESLDRLRQENFRPQPR